MPIVAVPVIAVVLIAILALLLIYAAAYAVNTLINMLPDWNIPGFTSVRRFVQEQAQTVLSTLSHWYHEAIGPAMNIIAWPIIAIETSVERAHAALSSANSALRYLRTTIIPGAVNSAVAYTSYAYNQAVNVALGYYNDAIANLNAVGAYLQQVIANSAATVTNWATGEIADARAYSLSLYNNAILDVTNTGAYILQNTAGLVNTTEQALLGDITNVRNFAASGLSDLTGDVAAALHAAEQYADTAAQAAVGLLVTDVDQAISQVESAYWPGVVAGIDGVTGALGDDLADILAGIKAIPRVIPTDLATSIAGVTALSIPMLKFMEQCGIPNCKNLSALGRDLQALLGLVGDAAFLEFILSLVHNPTDAANEVQNVLGDAFNGMLSTARELLSI